MQSQNGKSHALDSRLDALKAGIHRLVDRLETADDSRLRRYASSATRTIKEHPIAAAAVAFGIGYVVFRALRR